MYHSITFYNGTTKVNTYDDWHLVPETRPLVTPPTPKTKYLDVPGANGSIDLSTSLTGSPVFNDRTGTWTFYVLNDYGEWQDRFTEIMTFVQGQSLKVVLEDDPEYYYKGRFYVSKWSSEKDYSKIEFNYTISPYKVGFTTEEDYYSTTATVNLYSEPSTSASQVVTNIPRGSNVLLNSVYNDYWANCTYSGSTGYIGSTYLRFSYYVFTETGGTSL